MAAKTTTSERKYCCVHRTLRSCYVYTVLEIYSTYYPSSSALHSNHAIDFIFLQTNQNIEHSALLHSKEIEIYNVMDINQAICSELVVEFLSSFVHLHKSPSVDLRKLLRPQLSS
jgi:hypothetical protein